MLPKTISRIAALAAVICSLTLLSAAAAPPGVGPDAGTANARATINING